MINDKNLYRNCILKIFNDLNDVKEIMFEKESVASEASGVASISIDAIDLYNHKIVNDYNVIEFLDLAMTLIEDIVNVKTYCEQTDKSLALNNEDDFYLPLLSHINNARDVIFNKIMKRLSSYDS